MRQAAPEFVEIGLTQHLRLSLIGTPGHAGHFTAGLSWTGQGRSYAVRCGTLRWAWLAGRLRKDLVDLLAYLLTPRWLQIAHRRFAVLVSQPVLHRAKINSLP